MIYLANDHAGFELMNNIINYLKSNDIAYEHVGAFTYDSKDSYALYTLRANQKVAKDDNNLGIYVCGTGIGTSIMANRNKHIRAALCHNAEFANLARRHNNANVLALAGRYLTIDHAIPIINTFLNTNFDGGRHQERVDDLSK